VTAASQRVARLRSQGKAAHEAWNLTSVLLTQAAEAHCHLFIAKTFLSKINNVSDPAVRTVLMDLFQLHAVYLISTDAASFLKGGYMSAEQMDIIEEGLGLCFDKVRPNAVSLVDAFDFTDHHLGSALGRYDGNVYETLYKWAQKSPLNKTPVHESFKYLKQVAQSKL